MPKVNRKSSLVLSENIFPVVGVGASAGGLEAFKDLLHAIPEDSGMAYILIQHLATHHESVLTEILQKSTTLPVVEIVDNIEVLPNYIYIIPSNKSLLANDGILELHPLVKGERINTIDVFFTSLAEAYQEHAVGVILSGTGSDGTVGLKNIKDMGGITVAQDEASAAYFGMPQSAINAAVVDFILPAREIPGQLKKILGSTGESRTNLNAEEELQEDQIFQKILSFLHSKRGVDFNFYKQTTIRRRIIRRQRINNIESLKGYLPFLTENKEEQHALFNDILIPVTSFFRDPQIYTELYDKVFPLLVNQSVRPESIRIWVAGCSTGEEAYSIAICLYEYLQQKAIHTRVQIFATDISELVIAKARSGLYLKKNMAGLSETRIKQFFTKIDGSYQVNKVIREMCVFACQNFLKDPPFAKMDLISCRNVLIYMEPYLQKKALTIFHYSIKPNGFLLLGKSESIGPSSDQFTLLSKLDKIYSRKGSVGKFMPVATERNEDHLRRKDTPARGDDIKKDDYLAASNDALLAKYAPVGVIVNEQFNIVHFRGSTGDFLEAASGKASHNLLKMAREGLSFELRNALHKASTTGMNVRKEGITINKSKRKVDIEVIPLQNTLDVYYLVLFENTKTSVKKEVQSPGKTGTTDQRSMQSQQIEHLEKELMQLREDMRRITEDQEAANEELQSANEELLSSSEELQTLNEELETSKEEIQSTNEELTSLNQELIERNEQLIHTRKYSEAIVSTIHDPFVVLTKNLHIKHANKYFYQVFGSTEQLTEGKWFFEWGNRIFDVPELKEKLDTVLSQHSYFERFEITLSSGFPEDKVFLLNAKLVLQEANNEKLIVLTMKDVTERKKWERIQEEFKEELESTVLNRTRELHIANTLLEASNENLRQFASIAAHDLQEPLRKVNTFTSILGAKYIDNLPEDGKRLIAKIRSSVNRMSELIKQVLEYSKVANSKKEFHPTDLDLILKAVLDDLDLLVTEINGEIIYEKPLPTIDGIPLQLNQLFYNLLVNGLKFTSPSKVPVITVSSRMLTPAETNSNENLNPEIAYVEIQIADNGIGFEQQFAEQIFQLFERLHTEEEIQGTGVGLALCKKIVENHQGHIYAQSKENEGACFYIQLPLKQRSQTN